MKFQVGDLVRVREWDDMADEFGLNEDGDIHIHKDDVLFMKEMAGFCGEEFEITSSYKACGIQVLGGHPWPEWGITSSMVRLVEEEEELDMMQSLNGFISSFGKEAERNKM